MFVVFDIFLEFIAQKFQSVSDEFEFLKTDENLNADENLKTSVKYADDTRLVSINF